MLARLVVMTAVSLPWFWLAFRENGIAFIAIFVVNHNIARYITDIHHHTEPFYYFLPILPGADFPLDGWLCSPGPAAFEQPCAMARVGSAKPVSGLLDAVSAAVFFLLALETPGYILPCIAPLALILGARISECFDAAEHGAESGAVPSPPGCTWCCRRRWQRRSRWCSDDYDGAWARRCRSRRRYASPAFFSFPAVGAAGRRRIHRRRDSGGRDTRPDQFAFPAMAGHESARGIARSGLASGRRRRTIATYRFFHHAASLLHRIRLTDDLPDGTLDRFAALTRRFLVVTDTPPSG